MTAQLERAGTPAPKAIGIDEISIRKGHTYRIVVSDLIRRRPIWFGGADRSEDSMRQLYDWLGEGKSKGIRLAVMDMWKPFRNFMLVVFQAGESLFQTGWFIESIATQVLVIFIIRTRRNPFKNHPHPWLTVTSLTVVVLAIAPPFTPAGTYFGFTPPPPMFFLVLAVRVVSYLMAVEGMKRSFYRRFAI